MANKQKGEVSLVVGGTSYVLCQSFNGMIEAEDASETMFGRRLHWDDIGNGVTAGGLRELRLFLWALLRKHHGAMTIEEVGQLVDDAGGLERLRDTLIASAVAAGADPKDIDALRGGKNARPRKARIGGTGERSTSPADASV